ncbi:hypothetical protein X777_08237 [Ooceraea biroi]|uniref:Uncharacterized protein n=1 Tax=Ooceraea biroi TaxID=2015173 RepID=A0A026WY79_OOCBI|nr:hypothetical protein X777_08237 [Ooceraea biroi]
MYREFGHAKRVMQIYGLLGVNVVSNRCYRIVLNAHIEMMTTNGKFIDRN